MAEPDDLDGLAGEYVLGTLDAAERAAVEVRLTADPALRRAVADWERRLQPLTAEAGAAPHPGLLAQIMARIDTAPEVVPAAVLTLRRQLRRWQAAAVSLGGLALAASLAAVFFFSRVATPGGEYVAMLAAGDSNPAFIATMDVDKRTISLRRIGAEPPPGSVYELWAIKPGVAEPQSLGLLQQASLTRSIEVGPEGGLTLAITLEPPGGRPPDQPAGPLQFKGDLIKVP